MEIAPQSPFMDCGDPACHDKQEMFRMATEAVSSPNEYKFSSLEKSVKQPAAYTQKESEFTVRDANGKIHECPPSRELLGRHSWTLVNPFIPYICSCIPLLPTTPMNQQKKTRNMLSTL